MLKILGIFGQGCREDSLRERESDTEKQPGRKRQIVHDGDAMDVVYAFYRST